jgi:hypothetical protein
MGWFPIDLLSTFPFYFVFPESPNISDYARLTKIPKIMRLFRLTK